MLLQKFFEPASVVLIGVSRQTGAGAYNNLEMLLSYGYAGRIYLVHPKVPEILGYRTYAGWPICRRSRTWRSSPWEGSGWCRPLRSVSSTASSGWW